MIYSVSGKSRYYFIETSSDSKEIRNVEATKQSDFSSFFVGITKYFSRKDSMMDTPKYYSSTAKPAEPSEISEDAFMALYGAWKDIDVFDDKVINSPDNWLDRIDALYGKEPQ